MTTIPVGLQKKTKSLRQTSGYPFPLVVVEESKVFRRGRDESHVPPDFVQFSVVLRLSGMCCLECVDLQPGPRVQCKVPAKVIYVDGVFCVVLFEVVPYYLKRLDGVCVLFTISHRENGKHRGFIQYKRNLVVLVRAHHPKLNEFGLEPYPARL